PQAASLRGPARRRLAARRADRAGRAARDGLDLRPRAPRVAHDGRHRPDVPGGGVRGRGGRDGALGPRAPGRLRVHDRDDPPRLLRPRRARRAADRRARPAGGDVGAAGPHGGRCAMSAPMLKLYEHVDQYQVVLDWIEEHAAEIEAAGGVLPPELEELLDQAEGALQEKVERVALVIQNLKA